MLIPGASTGTDYRAPYSVTVARCEAAGCKALEIAALKMDGLPAAVATLKTAASSFERVSLHLPDGGAGFHVERVVDLVADLPPLVAFVVHPHVVTGYEAAWERLGERLLLENLDNRPVAAAYTHKGASWSRLLAALPKAGICLDLAHALSVTHDLAALTSEIAPYQERIKELHISLFDLNLKHCALDVQHENWSTLAALLGRFQRKKCSCAAILETPCRDLELLKDQLALVEKASHYKGFAASRPEKSTSRRVVKR